MPKETTQISQEQINDWAELIGDFNPIHVDEEHAAQTDFEGTIAHGTMVLALCEGLVIRELGEDWVRGGSIKVRFVSPAKPGDDVKVSGVLKNGALRISCKNQDGQELLRGVAKINNA